MEDFVEISSLYSLAQNIIFLSIYIYIYITLFTIINNDVIALKIST